MMINNDLRLTFGSFTEDDDNTPLPSPEIELALQHWRELNATKSTWATFEAAQFEYERLVRVRYGSIHDNGTKEREIATRTYYIDPLTNQPAYWTAVHP